MRSFVNLAAALAAMAIGRSLAAPVITVHPGNANDIVITKLDTVNATTPAPTNQSDTVQGAKPALSNQDWKPQIKTTGQLPLSMVNNFPGGAINAYVTGLDSNNSLVMLQADGTFYYPSASSSVSTPQLITQNCAIPLGAQGSTTNITLPDYISAARIWFAEGELKFYTIYSSASGGPSLVEPSAVNPSDPSAAINWGFVELTNTEEGGLYANISYVDFVGLVLGMELTTGDGSPQTAEGLSADAVSTICADLKAQGAKDGMPWGDLCMADSAGNPLRVIAPNLYVASNPSAFQTYWDEYIDQVWTAYETSSLTINTQAAAGNVNCTVQNSMLTCSGDNRGYAKPTAGDIFGCNSGTFAIEANDNDVHRAIVPRLCAAFTRTTLMLNGGSIQPSLAATNYYGSAPTSFYSKFVHGNEVDGKGYAFSYDDVNPDGQINQSGVVADANPDLLKIIIGGPLSSSSGWS